MLGSVTKADECAENYDKLQGYLCYVASNICRMINIDKGGKRIGFYRVIKDEFDHSVNLLNK